MFLVEFAVVLKISCNWVTKIARIKNRRWTTKPAENRNGVAVSLPSPSSSSFLSTPASCLRHLRPATGPLPSPSQVGASKITVAVVQLSTIVVVLALEAPSPGSPPASVAHLCSTVAGLSSVPQAKLASPVSKEDLGRATWTFLHTLAAQYPDNPTRQQKKDVKDLVQILTRLYPCKECADHFKEVIRANPVQAGSHAEFSQWLCHVHNVVNRSLGKPVFPCERVDARWGKLDCEQKACELHFDASEKVHKRYIVL
ncbi:hypothetical protein Ahy_A06g030493 [Arachis hypogaea]|uniref:Sulfhydryl oxidase n=1 Tax=Arachis hypogaea TaxID=3818 RepID=A0A445CWC6_ARAHY|nr:hypothetical protein Ahy_A06g030493 [Arachis hypogaea]